MICFRHMKQHVKDFVNLHYGNQHAAKVIYGTLLLFVALIGIGSSGVSSGYLAALESLIAALAIIIAEDYAELIGFTIKNKRKLNAKERRGIFEDTVAVATFCLVPILVLLGSESGFYSLDAAFSATYALCVLVLLIFSYWASRLSRYNRPKSFLIAVITASIGIAIILAKFFFTK